MAQRAGNMEIGIALSSEEHGPTALVEQAQQAEAAGFAGVVISDHFHPWQDVQGQSPFVWTVIGAIGATTALRVTTAVTCPTTRIHPAIVAQAAATSAVLLENRFRLGVGTGEALNEHILGAPWPPEEVRLEQLVEAVEVMRELWKGGLTTHQGRFYTVHTARIYSRPDSAPPVLMSALGPKSTSVAAKIADGLITTKPDAEGVGRYRDQGGRGPVVAQTKVCWGTNRDECVTRAHRLWRTEHIPGMATRELPLPSHFEAASELVSEEMVAGTIPCGPDPAPYLESIEQYRAAGVDELYIGQIGPDLPGFLSFFSRELAPALSREPVLS